jgi:hypothetical protein
VPHGGITAPPELGVKPGAGSHMPRGGPLVTAGGLVFVATASDRTVRAYDRETGKVVWTRDLPTGSEGVPATYEVGGRQFIVFPVAAGAPRPVRRPCPRGARRSSGRRACWRRSRSTGWCAWTRGAWGCAGAGCLHRLRAVEMNVSGAPGLHRRHRGGVPDVLRSRSSSR